MVDLHVTWNGAEVSGSPVYLFTETGTYLNRSVNTGSQGHAQFQVPVKPYKFRVDYGGRQYWTGVITPIAHQALSVEVPLEQLAMTPTNNPNPTRYDGEAPVFMYEPIKVASLGSLIGILSQAVVAQVAQPKVYYFLNDHLGTPLLMTDESNKVVWEGRYDPFGECIVHPFATIENNFRLPGQYYDKETGLHYNYHRYYQARTGRYVTADPIGQAGGINFFAYVGNNPVNSVDPSGLLAGPWHFWITYVTGWNSGYGIRGSFELALGVTAQDRESMAKAASAANIHAMAGQLPSGQYQSQAEALAAAAGIIKSGPLFSALHAGQDLPGHKGESMANFGLNWSTVRHIFRDIFPSLETISAAFQDSKNILSSRQSCE